MSFDLDTLPEIRARYAHPPGDQGRWFVPQVLVVHTAESPETPAVARGIANYCAHPPANVYSGYKVIVDDTEAIRNCPEGWWDNGAGGAWTWGWNLCLAGTALQTLEQWNDPFSRMTITNAAAIAKQVVARYGIPPVKIHDVSPDALAGGRKLGICGHADVSAYYPASQGHSDPGAAFPWDTFIAMLAPPSLADVVAFLELLEALMEAYDMEHGMFVDVVHNPSNPTEGYSLDRWGGIHPFGGAPPVLHATGWWEGKDVARRITVIDWTHGAGYVWDLDGGAHPFGDAPALNPAPAWWGGGKIVPFSET